MVGLNQALVANLASRLEAIAGELKALCVPSARPAGRGPGADPYGAYTNGNGERRFKGDTEAASFQPGRAHPVTGELRPMTDEQRDFLKGMAAVRGGRGGMWMDAIASAETVDDGLELRAILGRIDEVKS
ncbi:MAG TPA: hypothetical protein VHK68_00735 [Gemmatimonadales bacterium]|nr:hypothetical protein [Gemmatimonadales bacterium]